MPSGARLVVFADDVALVVTSRTERALRRRIEWAIQRLVQWLKTHGLELVAAKTEMVVLTRQRNFGDDFQMSVEGATITTSPSAR